MYRNAYQRGMLTIFFSVGSKPLAIWESHIQDGYISRFLDQDIKSMVVEIGGSNVSTTYMICPKGKQVLGITMPFLVMVVKNLKKYFTFEVTILDETGTRRRFRVSNFQSSTQIMPLCTVMPICLSDGWNQIQFNLSEFTRRAYKKQFVEVQKVKINANIRLRRIYFSERLIPEDELPAEYKLFFPIVSKKKPEPHSKESKAPSQQALKAAPSSAQIEQKTEEVKTSKTSVHSVKKVPSAEKTDEKKETEGVVEKVPSEKEITAEEGAVEAAAAPQATEGAEEKGPQEETEEPAPTEMEPNPTNAEPPFEEPVPAETEAVTEAAPTETEAVSEAAPTETTGTEPPTPEPAPE